MTFRIVQIWLFFLCLRGGGFPYRISSKIIHSKIKTVLQNQANRQARKDALGIE